MPRRNWPPKKILVSAAVTTTMTIILYHVSKTIDWPSLLAHTQDITKDMDMYIVFYTVLRFVFDKAFLATWFIVAKIYVPTVLTRNVLVPYSIEHTSLASKNTGFVAERYELRDPFRDTLPPVAALIVLPPLYALDAAVALAMFIAFVICGLCGLLLCIGILSAIFEYIYYLPRDMAKNVIRDAAVVLPLTYVYFLGAWLWGTETFSPSFETLVTYGQLYIAADIVMRATIIRWIKEVYYQEEEDGALVVVICAGLFEVRIQRRGGELRTSGT
ncbi:hypothetical protein QBC47DRAFT_360151 [Echria macrotheca]|uniref:Uncharacterized protein n=1 Tax=Echria macrotheca TaxID=438768 RepID=A0AAJ0FCT3_9PEZI|nr:hypothetical protein QBC47DRAFT_360151 [Echria macrotheca]